MSHSKTKESTNRGIALRIQTNTHTKQRINQSVNAPIPTAAHKHKDRQIANQRVKWRQQKIIAQWEFDGRTHFGVW